MKTDLRSVFGAPSCLTDWRGQECRPARAFSLLQMIGFLAAISIAAAVLVPPMIPQMDKTAGDQESAALKSFGDALQQSIMRQRYIPAAADWAANIAKELGVDVASVMNSPRKQPRFFLIDPAFQIGINNSGLPYAQTNWPSGSVITNALGATIPPQSPRVLIVSSIGRTLAPGIASGVATAANFTNIWNAADGTVPTNAPAFAGWTGSGDDLKVQRVDLSPLFVRLVLSRSASLGIPSYSIDQTSTSNNVVATATSYFIQNSVLTLYDGSHMIDSQQILIQDSAFLYYLDRWRGSVSGAAFISGVDIAAVVDQYMAAYPNARAQNGTNQQSIVVQSMIAYMDAYSTWAAAGFPYTPAGGQTTPPSYLVTAQGAMVTAVQGQYLKNSYNPIEAACQ